MAREVIAAPGNEERSTRRNPFASDREKTVETGPIS
jgi:hypothetical protein